MKEGSLQLSINAIVILIMAVAMLGVGIYFINNVLSDQLESSIDIGNEIQQQIRKDLRDTGKKMSLSGLGNDGLKMTQRSTEVVYVGVANKKEGPLDYRIQVEPVGLASGSTSIVTPFYATGDKPQLAVGEVAEAGIKFTAASTRETEIYRISIIDTAGTSATGDDTTYATQEFFVTVI